MVKTMGNGGVSFVTECIYCPDCYEHVRRVFMRLNEPGSFAAQLGSFPIIAGRIDHLGQQLLDDLEALICHEVRIAVIPDEDGSQRFFVACPAKNYFET